LAIIGPAMTAAVCRSSPSSSPTPSSSSSASSASLVDAATGAACPDTTVIRARIVGRFEGWDTEAFIAPKLVVAIDWHGSTPPDGVVAELPLAAPHFAAEYTIDDLCADDGSTGDRIAIRCVAGADIARLVVTRNAGGLAVTHDAKQTLWEPSEHYSRCFELHGLEHPNAATSPSHATVDLDTLRKAWELDAPKCPRADGVAPVKVTLKIDALKGPTAHRCIPEGPAVDSGRATLLGAGAPKDLGTIANLCGGSHVTHWQSINGIEVEASDMGTVKRFAYQLGDRAYYLTEDGTVRAADLPCGARAVFGVVAPNHTEMR
jgi:hypothetical protein